MLDRTNDSFKFCEFESLKFEVSNKGNVINVLKFSNVLVFKRLIFKVWIRFRDAILTILFNVLHFEILFLKLGSFRVSTFQSLNTCFNVNVLLSLFLFLLIVLLLLCCFKLLFVFWLVSWCMTLHISVATHYYYVYCYYYDCYYDYY